MIKSVLTTVLLAILILITPIQIHAAGANSQIILGDKQPYGIQALRNPNSSIGNILSNAILILYIFGGLAVLVFIIWGAFDWITAGGDKEKIAAARRKIVNAFIGLTLLSLSAFIVSLFGQIVGFDPLNGIPLPRLDDPVSTTRTTP